MKIKMMLYKDGEDKPTVEVELENYNKNSGGGNDESLQTFVARGVNLGHNLVRNVFVDVDLE